jgi:hypothetical protein
MATAAEIKAKLVNKQQPQNAINKATLIEEKVYFAKIAHSKFIFSDGNTTQFYFGKLVVSPSTFPGVYNAPQSFNQAPNPNNGRLKYLVYQEELDAICPPHGNNPMIFKQETLPENMPVISQNAVSELELSIANQALNGVTTKVQQEVGQVTNAGAPSNPDVSTLDPDILKAAQAANNSVLGSVEIKPIDPAVLNLGAMSSNS